MRPERWRIITAAFHGALGRDPSTAARTSTRRAPEASRCEPRWIPCSPGIEKQEDSVTDRPSRRRTTRSATTLSHYRILGRLGEGMGVIYRALDTRLEGGTCRRTGRA